MIIRNFFNQGIYFLLHQESYFPWLLGGSKARKLKYFFDDANRQLANAIVTAGSASSNHAQAAAMACAQLGWKCTIVIHDNEDYHKANLLLMKLSGARLVFTTLENVGEVMELEMESYRANGFHPYYIHGGGHGLPGYLAFYDAARSFVSSTPEFQPDYVVHASGTGGTQAGLVVGFNEYSPESKVIGVSVARKAQRGSRVVRDACDELSRNLNLSRVCAQKICFRDDWIGDGYGSVYPELLMTIKHIAADYGVITDPTYTGKALHGLVSMIKSGEIEPGSKVLFWHTGGLINLFEHTQKLIE